MTKLERYNAMSGLKLKVTAPAKNGIWATPAEFSFAFILSRGCAYCRTGNAKAILANSSARTQIGQLCEAWGPREKNAARIQE